MYPHTFRIMVVFYLFTMVVVCSGAPNRFLNAPEKIEIPKHLNRVNKAPVKSIKSPDGDIIDCVHIHQQPAFEHPLLKYHNIKMKPDYDPSWTKDDDIKVSSMMNASRVPLIPQLWHANGKCPKETIPIRRSNTKGTIRTGYVKGYAEKKSEFPIVMQDGGNHEYAYVRTYGQFFGAKATMNVWNPKVQEPNEFSLGQLWITSGRDSGLNTIEAGWHVNPALYHDTKTRLFIYWTRDGYNGTGCHNLDCPGFVQTNFDIALGGAIPTSQVDGSQYDITIRIQKNPIDGRWWMHVGDKALGYWPPKLFTDLESATTVSWGGELINDRANGQHTTTQMGSGRFPGVGQGAGKVSYFKNIQIFDETSTFKNPEGLSPYTSEKNCYGIKMGFDDIWGNFFYYGGPGRNEQCP